MMQNSTGSNEQGRSLLEIIAALAIAAILLMSGTFGYNFLIQIKHRHDTVKLIQDVVRAADTSDVLKHYAPGDAIKMRDLVNTVGSIDEGYAMQLPDGMDSKMIVTAMKNGQYAMSLKIAPNTCRDVIEALSKMKATYFSVGEEEMVASESRNTTFVNEERGEDKPGYRLNSANPDYAKLKAEAIARCSETGMAGAVFNCAAGSISYGYIYGYICAGCPLGNFYDGSTCCKPTEVCGGKCNACGDEEYCHPTRNTCVECYVEGPEGEIRGTNQCLKKYGKDDFSHHICDRETWTCVECLEDIHCDTSGATYKVSNPNPMNTFCVNNVCSPCIKSYDGRLDPGTCPLDKPVCDSEKGCIPCPADRKYDVNAGMCGCPHGKVVDAYGTCANCFSSESQKPDPGCSQAVPICDESQETHEGDETFSGICVGCVDHTDCPANMYCENNRCVACTNDRPIWDADAEMCRVCVDSNDGVGADEGCKNGSKNYCNPEADDGIGECQLCLDSETGNTKDAGCSADKPICDADTNDGTMMSTGNNCVECLDDSDCKDGRICDLNTKMCVQCLTTEDCPEGLYCENFVCKGCPESEPLWDQTRERCVVCQDDDDGTGTDTGCESGDDHFCKESANNDKGKCHLCLDSESGTDEDAGCSADKPICIAGANTASMAVGSTCGQCLEDEDCEGGKGCNQETHVCEDNCPPETPVWDGEKCRKCQDTYDHTSDLNSIDLGCSAEAPMCGRDVGGGYGDACYSCSKGKEEAATYHLGCSSEKPVCEIEAVNVFGNTCHACVNDSADGVDTGCTEDKKYCDAASGKYGTKCMACEPNSRKGCGTGYKCNCEGVCVACNSNEKCGCPYCTDGAGRCITVEKACEKSNDSNYQHYEGGYCVKHAHGQNGDCNSGYYLDGKTCKKKGNAPKVCSEMAAASPCECVSPTPLKYNNTCVECLKHTDCPSDKPKCNSHSCTACPAATPVWSGSECKKCLNDSANGKDTGCTDAQPHCKANENQYGTTCVECATNDNCASRTDGKTVCNKNVCVCPAGQTWNGSKCVECTADSQCASRTDGKIWCDLSEGGTKNKCVGCLNHYSSGLARSCKDSKNPYCYQGACMTCTQRGAKADNGGVLTYFGKGAAKGTLGCFLCKDDKDGNSTDSGCSAATPRCGGTTKHGNGLYNGCVCPSTKPYTKNGACVECTANGHCSSRTDGKTWCNTSTNTCVGCDGHYSSGSSRACASSKPYCQSGVCKTCAEVGSKTDKGPTKGQVKTKFGKNSSGNLGCFLCIDNKGGKAQDNGCSSTNKICGSLHTSADQQGHNVCCPAGSPYWSSSDNKCYECTSNSHCGSNAKCRDHRCETHEAACNRINCGHYETHDGKTGCWANGWTVTDRPNGKCTKSGWKFYGAPGTGVCKKFCNLPE